MTTDAVGGVWRYALELCAALDAEVVLAVLGPAPDADQRAAAASVPGLRLVETAGDDALDALALPLFGTSSHAGERIDARSLPWPCAWAFGHEGQGLAPALAARCTATLAIPQPGGGESLNVATAAAICLYESARRQRR